MTTRRKNVEDVKSYFFRAMLEGYASGARPVKDTPLLGWKSIEHKEGDFHLVDMWHANPNFNRSSGVTTIYWRDIIIWVMHYGGWYDDKAIPVLRAALQQTYQRGEFIGGRGPVLFESNNMIYQNIVSEQSFLYFHGTETITNRSTTKSLGTHWYHGARQAEY